MINWRLVFDIFISFLKIGPITFGGGYAMIPVFEREVVTNRKWVKEQDISDLFAVAQSIPGAIAINSATFIGYRLAGVPGALAALFGVLIPTFLIVISLGIFYLFVQDNPKVTAAFQGIRPAIVALIAYAGYKIGKTAIYDKTTTATVIGTIFILYFLNLHPVLIILFGIPLGILTVKVKDRMGIATRLEKDHHNTAVLKNKLELKK